MKPAGLYFAFSYLFVFTVQITNAQGEMTSVYNEYYRINENSKKIKDARIKKSVSLIITKDRTDTLNISYYDINGNLVNEMNKIVVSTTVESKIIYQKYSYKYDELNRVAEKIDSSGGSVIRKVISYEEDGTLSAEDILNSKGEVIKEISHEYDQLARLIESTENDNIAKCKTVKKYTYDSYNNLAKYVLSSNCTDSLSKAVNITYVYKYDNKSNIIEKNSYFSSTSFKTETFTYGANGKVSKSYVITGNEVYTNNVYFYDNSNFLTKIEINEVNGEDKKKFLRFYTNDKFGNVIEIRELTLTGTQIYLMKYEYEFF
jgi:hypothetical protein